MRLICTKDDDNSKYLYSGYGTTFDGEGELSFGNTPARNIKTSGA